MKFNYNNKENKKYSMTSINSRQTSKEKEKEKVKQPEDMSNMNKLMVFLIITFTTMVKI